MTKRIFIFLAVFFAFTSSVFAQVANIDVAANMKDAFAEIAAEFKSTVRPEMRVVYGSSGNFAAQIMNGAPFNLFIAADEQFPLELFKNGKTVDDGSVYAIGKLVSITKISSGVYLLDSRADIAKAISKANKIAIAKSDLAPIWQRADVQYLKAEGLWDLAKDKLVYADNIGATTTYVASGAADLGFTAFSLSKSPELLKQTTYVVVDTKIQEAQDLHRFMQGPKAKAILQKYGYSTP